MLFGRGRVSVGSPPCPPRSPRLSFSTLHQASTNTSIKQGPRRRRADSDTRTRLALPHSPTSRTHTRILHASHASNAHHDQCCALPTECTSVLNPFRPCLVCLPPHTSPPHTHEGLRRCAWDAACASRHVRSPGRSATVHPERIEEVIWQRPDDARRLGREVEALPIDAGKLAEALTLTVVGHDAPSAHCAARSLRTFTSSSAPTTRVIGLLTDPTSAVSTRRCIPDTKLLHSCFSLDHVGRSAVGSHVHCTPSLSVLSVTQSALMPGCESPYAPIFVALILSASISDAGRLAGGIPESPPHAVLRLAAVWYVMVRGDHILSEEDLRGAVAAARRAAADRGVGQHLHPRRAQLQVALTVGDEQRPAALVPRAARRGARRSRRRIRRRRRTRLWRWAARRA